MISKDETIKKITGFYDRYLEQTKTVTFEDDPTKEAISIIGDLLSRDFYRCHIHKFITKSFDEFNKHFLTVSHVGTRRATNCSLCGCYIDKAKVLMKSYESQTNTYCQNCFDMVDKIQLKHDLKNIGIEISSDDLDKFLTEEQLKTKIFG